MTKKIENPEPIYGLISLMCSLVSLAAYGVFLAPTAVAFGIVSIVKNEKKKGIAAAGMILGGVGCLLALYGLIAYLEARTGLRNYLKGSI